MYCQKKIMEVILKTFIHSVNQNSPLNRLFFTVIISKFSDHLYKCFWTPSINLDIKFSSILSLFINRLFNVSFDLFRDCFKKKMGFCEELDSCFCKCQSIYSCIILQLIIDLSLPPLTYIFKAQHLFVHNLFKLSWIKYY